MALATCLLESQSPTLSIDEFSEGAQAVGALCGFRSHCYCALGRALSELGIVHWKFAPQLHAGATLGVIVTVLLMASITTMRKRRPSTFVVLLFAIGWAAGLLLTISFRLGLAHAFPAEWAEVGYALWGAAYIVAVCCFGAFLYEAFRALGKDGP